MVWPFISRRERLRRQAARWVARLNGPYDDQDRAEFELWYRSSAEHAEAYDRVAALFNAAGRAKRPEASVPGSSARGPYRFALAAAVACAALLAFVLLAAQTTMPIAEGRQQFAALSTGEGESRRFVLADDSEVLLSPDSALEVALGESERRLRLVRGEGRFSVAHEARPFIVTANGAEVIARGTRFVVSIATDRTTVSLIEGRVDVTHPSASGEEGRRRVTRLEAGQQLVVQGGAEPVIGSPAVGSRAASPTEEPQVRPSRPAMLQFDDTPLRQALEQVNGRGRPPVRAGDPAIADLRITGAFRAGDTAGFAESVAAAFDLELERGADGTLRLRRRPEARPTN